MKQVAIVGTQGVPASYGGFETLVENIIGDNCPPDIQYTVFCSSKDIPNGKKRYKGCRLKYIPLHANGIQSIPYDIWSLCKVIQGYDTILVLGTSGCSCLPIFRLLCRTRLIVNIDGLEHRRAKWGRMARWILRFSEAMAVRFADVVIADNKGIQDYVYETYHKKAALIAYGGNHSNRGFANALIRKNDRTETDNSTVFYFNIVIGIIVYAIVWMLAPYIANFYNMPLLDKVMKVTALTIPFYSLSIVQQAILTINIDFKSQAKISVISAFLSGVIGVILAYNEAGVWSLSIQMISAAFFRMLLLWWYIKWLPTKSFSKRSFEELFSFGSKLLLANIVVTVGNNITTLIIGKKFAQKQLGFYNRAEQIGYFPATNLTAILQRVTFPVFSQMQDSPITLRNSYLKTIQVTSLLTFFIMGSLFILAEPLIIALLTSKWSSSIKLLQILITSIMWWPFFALNVNILQVVGQSKQVLIIECIKASINIFAIFMASLISIEAVCITLSLTAFLNSFIYAHFTKKSINVSWGGQIKIMLPHILSAIVAGTISFIAYNYITNMWLKIMLGGCLYTLLYVGIAYVIDKSSFMTIYNSLKKQ